MPAAVAPRQPPLESPSVESRPLLIYFMADIVRRYEAVKVSAMRKMMMEIAAPLKKSKEPHMIPAVNLTPEGTATPPVAGASAAVGAASTRPMLYPPAAIQ